MKHSMVSLLSGMGFGCFLLCTFFCLSASDLVTEQPLSLRMFKNIDFVSAFDAIYTHAVALDEVDKLPQGFVRAWQRVKSGQEVIDLQDFVAALPILYDQLLMYRSGLFSEQEAVQKDIDAMKVRLQELEDALLAACWEIEGRLRKLENPKIEVK